MKFSATVERKTGLSATYVTSSLRLKSEDTRYERPAVGFGLAVGMGMGMGGKSGSDYCAKKNVRQVRCRTFNMRNTNSLDEKENQYD
jgi:hypothetical protein